MKNYAEAELIPQKENNQTIELKDMNNINQNVIPRESLPILINQISPS